jgi:hypothetical protein
MNGVFDLLVGHCKAHGGEEQQRESDPWLAA